MKSKSTYHVGPLEISKVRDEPWPPGTYRGIVTDTLPDGSMAVKWITVTVSEDGEVSTDIDPAQH